MVRAVRVNKVITKKRTKHILPIWLYNRVMKRNQNAMICFVGPTGAGKSYAALNIGEEVSELTGRDFHVGYVNFEPHNFMKWLNSPNMRKGSVIILDEAGVALNSRKWQSSINIMINKVIQTIRHKNFIMIMCVPDFSFIDAGTRKLFHMLVEMRGIDFKKKQSYASVKTLQPNLTTGKIYYHNLIYKPISNRPSMMKSYWFSMPSKELIIEYEVKKTEFTTKLNKEVETELTTEEEKNLKELTDQQERVLKLRNEYGLNAKKIALVMDITESGVGHHIKFIKNKGYKVQKTNRDKRELTDMDIEELRKVL